MPIMDLQRYMQERKYETLEQELRQAWRDVQGLRDGHYQIIHLLEEIDIMLKYSRDLPDDVVRMLKAMKNKLLPRAESKSKVRIVKKPEQQPERGIDFYA